MSEGRKRETKFSATELIQQKRETTNSSCDPEQPGPPLTESTLANNE